MQVVYHLRFFFVLDSIKNRNVPMSRLVPEVGCDTPYGGNLIARPAETDVV